MKSAVNLFGIVENRLCPNTEIVYLPCVYDVARVKQERRTILIDDVYRVRFAFSHNVIIILYRFRVVGINRKYATRHVPTRDYWLPTRRYNMQFIYNNNIGRSNVKHVSNYLFYFHSPMFYINIITTELLSLTIYQIHPYDIVNDKLLNTRKYW